MGYKLLAIDIDGTLLDPEGQISPRVREAVRLAVEAGCLVTLATGRRQRPARLIAGDLGLKLPLILYTGSLIYDTASNQALVHRPLSPAFLTSALALIREAGLLPKVLQSPLKGEYIYLGPEAEDDAYSRAYAQDKVRFDMIRRLPYPELSRVEDALTISVAGPGGLITRLFEITRGRLECSIFSYPLRHKILEDLHGFDLIQPGVSKGVALRWLAANYGIKPEETLAIGDSLNDLEMIRAAGLGVAMGNASLEVKAQAGAVVAGNEADGVAEAIERFILGV